MPTDNEVRDKIFRQQFFERVSKEYDAHCKVLSEGESEAAVAKSFETAIKQLFRDSFAPETTQNNRILRDLYRLDKPLDFLFNYYIKHRNMYDVPLLFREIVHDSLNDEAYFSEALGELENE